MVNEKWNERCIRVDVNIPPACTNKMYTRNLLTTKFDLSKVRA